MNQKASQPAGEVGQDAFGLILRIERTNAQIRFRRDAPWLPDEWRADDPCCRATAGSLGDIIDVMLFSSPGSSIKKTNFSSLAPFTHD